jgi:flagellar basal body-associated protein FliL
MGKEEKEITPVVIENEEIKGKKSKKKDKAKKEKKPGKGKKILIALLIIILIAGAGFGVYKIFFDKDGKKSIVEVKVLDSLDDYGYTLSDKDTDLFKDEYNVLKDLLNEKEIDDEKYATQVAKLFVIDLYTINTKVNKLDIGGSEYYYLDKVTMFEKKVMDTLYYHLEDNTYGDREQELPEVKKIEVLSIEETEYKIGEKEKDAYLVQVEWEYVEDMGYDTEASIVLCKEDGVRISVVDFQPTLEPEYEEEK